MKKLLIPLLFITINLSAFSETAYTKHKTTACIKKSYLENFNKLNDKSKKESYIKEEKCFKIKPGTKVNVVNASHFHSYVWEFILGNVRYWTNKESLDFDIP